MPQWFVRLNSVVSTHRTSSRVWRQVRDRKAIVSDHSNRQLSAARPYSTYVGAITKSDLTANCMENAMKNTESLRPSEFTLATYGSPLRKPVIGWALAARCWP